MMKEQELYRHGGMAEQNILHDFSVNVNPLGPSPAVIASVKAAAAEISRYPDPAMRCLREKIAETEQKRSGAALSPADILLGNGASELITVCIRALSPETVLLQTPNFYGYERALSSLAKRSFGIENLACEPEHGFRLPADMPARIRGLSPSLVCLCNPANPTGVTIPPSLLMKIADTCEETESFLLIDECFIEFLPDFRARTLAPLLKTYPHLLLLRAFTKLYAMPGLRLGYAYQGAAWKDLQIENELPEWHISNVAEAAGLAALQEEAYFGKTAAVTEKNRAALAKGLSEALPKDRFSVISGEANFLFVRMDDLLYEALLNEGILLRKCDNYRGLPKDGYYRIAVKSAEENAVLIEACRALRHC